MPLTPPVSADDHIKGADDAPIELVEYGDFQCPHCGRAYPILKNLTAAMPARVKFIFRNFPLSKIHPQAKQAAIAAEAAAIQDKFWNMHALLFENQRHLNQHAILGYAQAIGLDLSAFQSDLLNESLAKKVDKQFMSGLRSGVDATPSFFINGERYHGSWEGNDLQNYIESLPGPV